MKHVLVGFLLSGLLVTGAHSESYIASIHCGNAQFDVVPLDSNFEIVKNWFGFINKKSDSISLLSFYFYPDGCASSVSQPENEQVRCMYLYSVSDNNNIIVTKPSEHANALSIYEKYIFDSDILTSAEIVKDDSPAALFGSVFNKPKVAYRKLVLNNSPFCDFDYDNSTDKQNECNKNTFSYMNCNAGQLVDICNGVAFWKKQTDCCDEISPYKITTEKITSKNYDFYKPYSNYFDDKPQHCALKTGIINQ